MLPSSIPDSSSGAGTSRSDRVASRMPLVGQATDDAAEHVAEQHAEAAAGSSLGLRPCVAVAAKWLPTARPASAPPTATIKRNTSTKTTSESVGGFAGRRSDDPARGARAGGARDGPSAKLRSAVMASTRRPAAARLGPRLATLAATRFAGSQARRAAHRVRDDHSGTESCPAPRSRRTGRGGQGRGGGRRASADGAGSGRHRRFRRGPSHDRSPLTRWSGFLPYWEVGSFTPDYQSLTTLVYWAVNLANGGSIAHHGPGWSDLTSRRSRASTSSRHTPRATVCCSRSSRKAPRSSTRSPPSPSAAGRRLAATRRHCFLAGRLRRGRPRPRRRQHARIEPASFASSRRSRGLSGRSAAAGRSC